MELLSGGSPRVLAYVAALNRGGYRPSRHEVSAYAVGPDRARVPHWSNTSAMIAAVSISLMGGGTDETMVDYLARLGVLVADADDRFLLSPLGLALLPALEAAGPRDEVIEVLQPGDNLGLPRIMAKIGAAGTAMLADPYLTAEDALQVATTTRVSRILLSERSNEKVRDAIRAAFSALTTDHEVEVRVAGRELHDRFLIPDEGPVTSIGGSLNGASKHLMVLTELGDSQKEIRKAYGKLWKNASQWAMTRVPQPDVAPLVAAAAGPASNGAKTSA